MTDTTSQPAAGQPDQDPAVESGSARSDRSVLSALADGIVRAVNATRTTPRQVRLRGKLAVATAREARAKAHASRALRREAEAAVAVAATPEVLRALPTLLAAVITVVLMATSLLTLATILAVSDVPTVEAWLLPAAFGPVFVIITKLLVAWLFTSTQDKPRTTRRIARLLIAALLVGLAAVVAGVAIKSMVIGADEPLDPADAMLSSAAMFGAVVLAECIGAAVLAAVQHAPGAREWDVACRTLAQALRRAEKAIRAAFTAEANRTRIEALLAGWQEWAAGRGALASAFAHHKAVTVAGPEDPILLDHTVEAVHVPAPPAGLLPVQEPATGLIVHRWDHADHPNGRGPHADVVGAADLDAEFRRLLADHPQHEGPGAADGQDPLW